MAGEMKLRIGNQRGPHTELPVAVKASGEGRERWTIQNFACGAKCWLDLLGKCIKPPRKKLVHCIILPIHNSYYPIAVIVFCVHPETPDSVDVTKGDRSSLNLV